MQPNAAQAVLPAIAHQEEMLKLTLFAAAFGLLAGHAALAQPAPETTSSTPPAVATSSADSKTEAAPVAGKNSFTEAQARQRLADHGYSDIGALKLDDGAVWRGTAAKDGKTKPVALDYQGNIVGE